MATTVAKLQAVLDADTRGFDSRIRRSEGVMHKAGHAIGVAALAAGAAIATGLGITAKIGWDEFEEGQKEAAQTNAVLKSTGMIAGITAKHVENLANSQMHLTGIDDELIVSGQNLLLTFTNIRNEAGKGNDVFDQAIKTTEDLSIALGQDMKQSAIQVGKALQNPTIGLTALRRVGVSFTESQKDMIIKLDESGHHLEAQKMILHELQKEFGGSAKAAGETLPGKIAILQESFRNFAGDLVANAIPTLQKVLDFFNDFGKAKNMEARLRIVLTGVKDAATSLVGSLRTAIFGETTRKPLKLPSGQIVEWKTTDSQGLVDAIAEGVSKADWSKVGTGMAAGIKDAFVRAAGKIPATPEDFVRAIGLDPDHDYWKDFENWLRKQTGKLEKGILDGLKPDWGKGGKWISDQLGLKGAMKILNNFGDWVGSTWKGLLQHNFLTAFAPLAGRISGWLSNAGSAIKSKLGQWIGTARSAGSGFVSALVGAFASLPGRLASLMRSALNAVIGVWNSLSIPGFHIGLPGPVPDINFGGASLPDIPLLDRGGTVMRTGLAIVHKGETYSGVGRGLGGVTVNVGGSVIAERDLRSLIQKLNDDWQRRGGR